MYPVFVRIGPLAVPSYLALALLGIAVAMWHAIRSEPGRRIPQRLVVEGTAALVLGGLLGARANFVLSEPEAFRGDPLRALRVWQGGFVFLGGLAGALGALAALLWWRGAPLARHLDQACVAIPLVHAFGRIGCVLAGCCTGLPCPAPPGVRLVAGGTPCFPAALVEAALLVPLFLLLDRLHRHNRHPGLVLATYLYAYALIRFPLEFLRPESLTESYLFGLTLAQSTLLAGLAIAVACHGRALRRGAI
jgi:phosphatidylglycerol:prolipoprotein diacylglycerol transferase